MAHQIPTEEWPCEHENTSVPQPRQYSADELNDIATAVRSIGSWAGDIPGIWITNCQMDLEAADGNYTHLGTLCLNTDLISEEVVVTFRPVLEN